MIERKRIKIIQFEFNEMNSISRVFMEDFFSCLKDYKLYRALPKELLLTERIPVISEIYAYQNI